MTFTRISSPSSIRTVLGMALDHSAHEGTSVFFSKKPWLHLHVKRFDSWPMMKSPVYLNQVMENKKVDNVAARHRRESIACLSPQ
jgi:hypothetical protein